MAALYRVGTAVLMWALILAVGQGRMDKATVAVLLMLWWQREMKEKA